MPRAGAGIWVYFPTHCLFLSPVVGSCLLLPLRVVSRSVPSPSVSFRLPPSICAASRQIRMPTSISEPPGATPGCASAWRGRRAAHAALWAPPPTGRTLTPSRSPASIPFHPLAYRVPPWRTVQFRSGQANLPKKQHNTIDLLIRIRNKYRTVVVCRRRATCPCEKRSGTKRNCKIFHTPL